MMKYNSICIDLKSFYASVECMERGIDPLTAYLVVADESRTDKTICLAVSPALKAYGIPGRPRLFEVKQKLRELASYGINIDLVIAPPQMAKYIEVSSQIYSIYLKYIAKEDIHVYSIDEVFIDIGSYLSVYNKSAKELATMMIHDVLQTTGITATAGIGTNLYLAKIAMDIVAKHTRPNQFGVRMATLDEDSYKRLLWSHTPLTDFWRVGKGIAKKLAKYGMYTMGDVARQSLDDEELLFHLFGVDAEILIDHAWGIEPCTMYDIKHYEPDHNSFGSGQVLSMPYSFKKGRLIVREMMEELILDLTKKKMMTDAIVLHIAYDREMVDNGFYQGETKLDYYGRVVPKDAHGTENLRTFTNNRRRLLNAALRLYDRIVNQRLTIRKVTITFAHVQKAKGLYTQLDIFNDIEEEENEDQLENVLLNIKEKYGSDAAFKATDLEEGATTLARHHQIGGHKA